MSFKLYRFNFSVFFLFLFFSLLAHGAEEISLLDEVVISSQKPEADPISNIKNDEAVQIETVTKEKIEHQQAQTLIDALANESGVTIQNSCANCGARQVMLNGLTGQQTTLLIDGVPLHSAVSNFYGLDSIPTVGIESIEISRGAGNALIAPESIGGVIQILTPRARENRLTVMSTLGTQSNYLLSLLGTAVGDNGKNRAVIAGQLSNQGHWDVDQNKVTEAPDFGNQSAFIKFSRDISARDTLEFRLAKQRVKILGGNTIGYDPTTYTPAQPIPRFTDNDVSQPYLDQLGYITDSISLDRTELVGRWNRLMNEDWSIRLTSSYAYQTQNSIYMHGYDYRNQDHLFFNELKSTHTWGQHHIVNWGLEYRNQFMNSFSDALYVNRIPPLVPDSFQFKAAAAFFQDSWILSEKVELSTALRLNWLSILWTDLGTQIIRPLVAPRASLKWSHSDLWTSRFSYGLGYRAPLSFLESQHGLDESGFQVAITEIETGHNFGYSLHYAQKELASTISSHYTILQNLAYAQESTQIGQPALFKNYDGSLGVWANDIVIGYQIFPTWNIQTSYEKFIMSDTYKSLLPVAAVEDRIRLISDYHFGNWEFVGTLNWIGARNLRPYGYSEHFRTAATIQQPPFFTSETVGGEQKWLDAPAFFTLDLFISRPVSKIFSFYAGIQNVFNYTQTGAGDSPLNFSQHGSDPTHLHLDNNHVWGPLRGRIFSIGLKATL